ncbi:zinc ribbon domain-containing protein [Thermophilibacter sp.]
MALTCPSCGARVDDGALECPRCHAQLDVTRRISLAEASWCPSCGALVAPGAATCPKCGARVAPERPVRRERKLDLPDISDDEDGTGRTGVMTRIESAIPAADDESGRAAVRDRIPRPRVFALAALLAVVVVGGATLLITHPWDPAATRTRASEPADTSRSGFPGTVETLSGQDSGSASKSDGDGSGAATPLEQIASAHESLGELAERVNRSEDSLRALVSGRVEADAAEGLSDARATSIEVSNLISGASTLSDGGGAYAEDLEHLVTLANWLRNRCDALTAAWGEAAGADDATTVADSVTSTLDGASDYRALFERNYDDWAPSSDDAS